MTRPRVDDQLVPLAADLVSSGVPPPQIRDLLARQHPSTAPRTERQLAALIEDAKALIRQRVSVYEDLADVLDVDRLTSLYRKCVAAGDRRTALAVQQALMSLRGGAGDAPEAADSGQALSFDEAYRRRAQA